MKVPKVKVQTIRLKIMSQITWNSAQIWKTGKRSNSSNGIPIRTQVIISLR